MIRGKILIRDVNLYPGEPGLYIRDPYGPVIRDLETRMGRAQRGAKRMVRKRTGRLAASIRRKSRFTKRAAVVEVIAGGRAKQFPHTLIEHDGSPPHIIRARRKKALRFEVGGQVLFRKQVRHPGTRGTKYLQRALPLAGGF